MIPQQLTLVWLVYFSLGGFLELMVRKGGWYKYLLMPTEMRCSDYSKHLWCSCRDLFILLPIAFFVTKSRILLNEEESVFFYNNLLLNIPKVIASVCIGYFYRMLVHMAFHTRLLYKRFHRQHHVPLSKLNSFVCFNDSIAENIIMEIIGVFILPAYLVPVPPDVLTLIWLYGVCTGLLDHSCLYISDKWWIHIDCRYHLEHHMLPNCNYAELECLDRVAGTYR